ncbi:MAG: hypothetical protein A3E26_05020 [Chlamydiae bacterium RIFCSPHIGHO2_12_FULL_49_32]|nr:MAG: hypothetical protein A2098_04365 [Chlamydiae bacterium GWF2_49_8]OGN63120.1 MAG: hypothetical protein A3E26_05020 [Chlamydiae bacterium RIFCSPHIGHO2_12_FULL_49_32]
MAIYDIFEPQEQENEKSAQLEFDLTQEVKEGEAENYSRRDRLFSTLVARLFFFLLLIADGFWMAYSVILFSLCIIGYLLSCFKVPLFKETAGGFWVSVKRSFVCGISLFLALFSPAFGIMIACTYFLMYDKAGIEEVVPASLQAQFKEFFKS